MKSMVGKCALVNPGGIAARLSGLSAREGSFGSRRGTSRIMAAVGASTGTDAVSEAFETAFVPLDLPAPQVTVAGKFTIPVPIRFQEPLEIPRVLGISASFSATGIGRLLNDG